jgi:hypothetical protein
MILSCHDSAFQVADLPRCGTKWLSLPLFRIDERGKPGWLAQRPMALKAR